MALQRFYTTIECERKSQKITKKITLIVLLLLLSAATISCSQKFPVATTDDVGILVIPLQVTADTEEKTFLYHYRMGYSPETSVDIVLKPSLSTSYAIIDNFPVGTYVPNSLTTIGLSMKKIGSSNTLKKEKPLHSVHPFTIKAKSVTLLSHMFVISKTDIGGNRWTQSRHLKYMTQDDEEDLISKLRELENSNQWKFE